MLLYHKLPQVPLFLKLYVFVGVLCFCIAPWQLASWRRLAPEVEEMRVSSRVQIPAVAVPPRVSPVPFSSARLAKSRLLSGCTDIACEVSHTALRDVSAHAVSASSPQTEETWWKKNVELWHEVHTNEEFQKAINDDTFQLVLVDWYAPWCHGCKRAYPELCKLAALDKYQSLIKFVKVSIDEMRSLSKAEGVKALPQVGLYRPGHGFLMSFQAVPSQMRIARSNLDIILANPGKYYKLDPNGVVMVVDEDPAPERNAARKAAADLAAQGNSLFERLMASANGYAPTVCSVFYMLAELKAAAALVMPPSHQQATGDCFLYGSASFKLYAGMRWKWEGAPVFGGELDVPRGWNPFRDFSQLAASVVQTMQHTQHTHI